MYCKNCGKKIAEQARFCTNCGNRIEEPKNKTNNDIYKKYIRWIFFAIFFILGISGLVYNLGGLLIILGAFILSPIFILILKKFNIKIVELSSIIISTVLIIVGMGIVSSSPKIGTTQNSGYNNTNKENLVVEEVLENADNVEDADNVDAESFYKKENTIENTDLTNKDFGEDMINNLTALGFTAEEATDMQSIFYKIGVTSISNVQASNDEGIDKLTAFVGYANGNEQKKFWFTIEKRQLIYAGFRDETLYDTSKGGILKNINDVHIPETKVDMETYTTLQVKAQDAVKQYLNYPDIANFPLYDGWGIARNDNDYKINGKVNAKNAFGVENEINFSVWFNKVDNQFNVEAVELDGVRVK